MADTDVVLNNGSGLVQNAPIALVVALCFVLYASQASIWAILGVFDQIDVIFDTDPLDYLVRYASGWAHPSIIHSGLSAVGVGNRALAQVFGAAGLTADPVSFSNALASFVAPLSGAIAVFTVYRLGMTTGCRRAASVVIAAAYGVMFVSRVFFAMPESYPLASVALLCAFLLVSIEARQQRDLDLTYWALVSALAAATTITNVAAVGLAFVASRWARRGINARPVIVASIMAAFSLIFCLILLFSLNLVLFGQFSTRNSLDETASWAQKYLISNAGSRLLLLASQPVHLLGLPELGVGTNRWGIAHGSRYLFSVTYEPMRVTTTLWTTAFAGASIWIALFIVGLRDQNSRPLALAALLVLFMNLLLHVFFGVELFLYAQHFSAALAAACVSAYRARPMRIALLGILTVAIALQGQYRIDTIDRFFGL